MHSRRISAASATLCALVLFAPQPGDAQPTATPRATLPGASPHSTVPGTSAPTNTAEPPREWQVALGAALLLRPDYLGSSRYEPYPAPIVDVRWRGDTAFLGFRPGLGINLYGAGVTLFASGPWRAGPVVRYRLGRDEGANPALRGLGDVDGTFEAGGFLAYVSPSFRASLEFRNGLGGGHGGLAVDLIADALWRPVSGVPLQLSVGPRAAWGGAALSKAFFGIDAAQALRSGSPPFRASDTFILGVAAGAAYSVTPNWTVAVSAEVGRILGGAADSPLVRDRGSETQTQLGLSVTYRF